MTFEIRKLHPNDRGQWALLWKDYLAFYKTELPQGIYDATFDAFFTEGEHHPRCLVADQAGELLGIVHFIHHAHCWKPEGVIYLQDLFTQPRARGTGIARALIEAVYADADKRGAPYVYWLTQDFNHTARKLYDQVGMLTPFLKYQRPQ